MYQDEIYKWVNKELEKGYSKEELKKSLLKQGYPKYAVSELLENPALQEKQTCRTGIKIIQWIAAIIISFVFVLFPFVFFNATGLMMCTGPVFFIAYMLLIGNILMNRREGKKQDLGNMSKLLPAIFFIFLLAHINVIAMPILIRYKKVSVTFLSAAENINTPFLPEQKKEAVFPEKEMLLLDKNGSALTPVAIELLFNNILGYYEIMLSEAVSGIEKNILPKKEDIFNAVLMDYDSLQTEMFENIIRICDKTNISDHHPKLSIYCANMDILLKCKGEDVRASQNLVELFMNLNKKRKKDCLRLLESLLPSNKCKKLDDDLGIDAADFTKLEKICGMLG